VKIAATFSSDSSYRDPTLHSPSISPPMRPTRLKTAPRSAKIESRKRDPIAAMAPAGCVTVDGPRAVVKMPEKVLKIRRTPAADTKVPAIMISMRVEGVENSPRSTLLKSRNPMVRTAIAASSMTKVTGNSKEMLRNRGAKTAIDRAEVSFMD